MPQNWKTYKLDDLVSKLGDGLHGTPKYSDDGEYAFINGNNLDNGKINIKPETKRVNEDQYLKYKKELNDRTLLVSINGSLGKVAFYNGEKIMLGKSACYFNVKDDVDVRFIKHVISSGYFLDYLENTATGSVIKNVPLRAMRDFPINLPPLPEQRAIASILSSLDDKIEINLQMNKTLEEMAMTLYKHWFVDFGPFKGGKFIDSELGPIPEGWEVVDLKEICRVINGRAYKNDEFLAEGTPIIRIQNLTGGGKTVYSNLDLHADKYVESGDLIYAWSATFGPYIWHGPKSIYHYHIWKLEMISRKASKHYLFQHLSRASSQMKEHGTGSIFTHLTKGTMETQRILVPPIEIMDEFEVNASTFIASILSNKDENQTLTSLRDTLLPKLISGAVRVKDVESQVAEVL